MYIYAYFIDEENVYIFDSTADINLDDLILKSKYVKDGSISYSFNDAGKLPIETFCDLNLRDFCYSTNYSRGYYDIKFGLKISSLSEKLTFNSVAFIIFSITTSNSLPTFNIL